MRAELISSVLAALVTATGVHAATLEDYRGTVGKMPIGLTLVTGGEHPITAVGAAHYFYVSKRKDISLKVVSLAGRDLVLEEDDAQGKPVATFKLSFAKQDPQHHYAGIGSDNLTSEVMIGSWVPVSGSAQDVYLNNSDAVSGDADSGRCDLDAKAYGKLQSRVAQFYQLAMKGNAAAVQKQFKAKLPKETTWRAELAKTVPHDLFCNDQGFTLGNGIVWFNPDGNVIRINK